jgi:hypothetical protein
MFFRSLLILFCVSAGLHQSVAQTVTPIQSSLISSNVPADDLFAGTTAAGRGFSSSVTDSIAAAQPGQTSNPTPPDAATPPDPTPVRTLTTAERRGYRNATSAMGVTFAQSVGNLRIYAFAQNRTAEVGSFIYTHPAGRLGATRVDYIFQVPIYALHEPRYFDYESIALTTEKRVVFGGAIFPAGVRVIFNPKSRFQVGLMGSGGFVYFTRRILSEGATKFNIGLEFGNTFEYEVSPKTSIAVGYAINHLSNSNTHFKNPGLDLNTVYVQYLHHLHTHTRS